MLIIYNIAIRLYYCFIYIAAPFNKKASLWIEGRKKNFIRPLKNSIWFHFASLGEFEQGRPVLESLKSLYPNYPIIVTFFSPSGYEIRKNTPLADAVYYLPLDTVANAHNFIHTINPIMAVFTKYEYWYHFFNELHQNKIPLYIISGIFRPNQIYFKWYGGFNRKILKFVTHFFVQDNSSKLLLEHLNISNVTISGDTRFDRVWANGQQPKALPLIQAFTQNQSTLIAGSTWPDDEQLIAAIADQYNDWKFIIAPHEIAEDKITKLVGLLPLAQTIRFSQIQDTSIIEDHRILIIDNIGMLSSLYQYGKIAYIGGGFGAGIHNTLEAAAFGLPVIFGPNYQKFKEARDLIEIKAGFSISSQQELEQAINQIMTDEQTGIRAKDYVRQNIGATDTIVKFITNTLQ